MLHASRRCIAVLVGLATACAPHAPADPTDRAPPVAREVLTTEPFKQRLPAAPADLVVRYGAENHGSLETCGCPRRPRGSLARWAGYADAADAAAPSPSVRVHAGYWLDDAVDYAGQPRLDAEEMDRWAMRGLAAARFDALNVSEHDVTGLLRVPPDPTLPLVSATISGPGVRRWVMVERGGLKIGITGISGPAPTMADTSAYDIRPAADAVPVLAELVARADVVVLLAWSANDAVRSLLTAVPGIDVVIDAGLYVDALPPVLTRGALWTFTEYQLVRAGELRLTLDGGRVSRALDRHVDLDAAVPEEPAIAAITREARRALDGAQRERYGGD
jgi:2',3'-cyclic-nucleotide 2'-phosphodiesterase (5'-nucleotidase family)